MSKWKKSSSLDQLSMGDSSNPRETFMFVIKLTCIKCAAFESKIMGCALFGRTDC